MDLTKLMKSALLVIAQWDESDAQIPCPGGATTWKVLYRKGLIQDRKPVFGYCHTNLTPPGRETVALLRDAAY